MRSAFYPGDPDEASGEWTRLCHLQRAPLYRRDLDMAAVAPGGEFAAFCTVWFDDVTRTGAFEPVGVAPVHRRRGLGRALMCEGLRRLERLGATVGCTSALAIVCSESPAAYALYTSVGFTEVDLVEPWVKP